MMCRDTNKFIELLRPNYNDAVKYCKALCSKQSLDDAKDVLQQSLLQALENFDSLNDETSFRSWLFTIITRVFYTSIKRNFWKRFLPINDERINDIPEIFSKDDVLDSRTILNKALSKLSVKERAAILLYEIGEFSIEEIKLIQDEKSASTIKSRLSRTRKKLKKYIINFEHNSNHLKNDSTNNIIGDLENETIKLASEYRAGE